ncbi:ABC transporter ATP-binding protein [Breznakiella homolactica]|uniref:ABC transporter ATP-binding protein n=1 Tax=Breznakiella homolactica TaxID=2798577 RepID=A0A7T7XJY2_9SPIR|nr:ABC transporter ATP-binding protein [Breznakiella homolactica]QQO07784.1 ABC transporter ATP-binding protein/permease [Breznakiella homolactica]
MKQRKEKQPRFNPATIKRLLGYITNTYKLRFILVLVFILLSAAASVAGSLFLQILIDDYIAPLMGADNPVFTGLLQAIGTMGLIYLAGVVSSYVYNRQMVIIGQGVQKRIRDEMFGKMQKLPVKYFDTHSYGDIMSRYTNDIDTLRQMISQSLPMFFSSCVTIIMVFCAMVWTSIPLTLIVIVSFFVMLKVSGKVAGKSGAYFVRQQEDLGTVNGYIEEMMNGQKVVKVFNYEEESKKNFDERNERLFESGENANRYANTLMPLLANLSNLAYVLVAIGGGALALGGLGGLTLGAIVTFLQLTKSFSQPISQMSQQLNSIVTALAGAGRIFALMDEEPEADNGYVTLVNVQYDESGCLAETDERIGIWAWKHPHGDGTLTYTKVEGHIEFADVDFSYDGENTVLYDVSIAANPGEKIAFVGATGAGKTTITNLLNRFYDIADGKIRYDGININKIRKSDLRRSLGIVLQDTHLFTGTVMENIRYGRLDAADDEVIAAARLAGADGFIERLPEGYGTMLSGGGSGLSQGQRQLLAIARAAVADPPVMILDEATSSIDTRTEKLVQGGMDALMEGRTVFVIAHRLSTIRNSQAIMVLDQGRIVEQGNHDELIEQKGRYYRLYTGAFETADELAAETA